MREIFTYGSVGGAPGNRCSYPEEEKSRGKYLEGKIMKRAFEFTRPVFRYASHRQVTPALPTRM